VYGQYLEKLTTNEQEDFDGLMWRAVDSVQHGSLEFVRDKGKERGNLGLLRFVMVDEFQDFSEMFFRLLQAIRRHNPAVNFFCVGDDWQAINAFAGSDLRFFQNFGTQWRHPSTYHIRTNWRSASSIVAISNRLMVGMGELAHAKSGANTGLCQIADLEAFVPNPTEEHTHEGDHITPAVLRIVQDCLRNNMDVALLARRHGLPYYISYREERRSSGKLEAFEEHLKSFLPKDDRRRVTVCTAHSYKGLECPAVVVMDGIERSYPLIHPNWVFMRALGDSIDQTVEEERRLFYVALTRASQRLIVVTEGRRRSPFLDFEPSTSRAKDADFVRLDWQALDPTVSKVRTACLEIRVEGYEVKDLLKADGFSWRVKVDSDAKYWRKIVNSDGFDRCEQITSRPWFRPGIRVTVVDDSLTIVLAEKP
jgi:DNA helicase IV